MFAHKEFLAEDVMPELPEVETIKNGIAKSIGCCKIRSVSVRQSKLREPVPADIAQKASGAKIIGYLRRAKYIIINLDNGLSLIWHMGMSGKVTICNQLPEPLGKHDHIIIETDKGYMVYNDPRRFGLFTYAPTQELQDFHLFADLGIEPFDPNLNAEYLSDKLKKKKIAIKPALLDQSIIVGIGNIYASEILYDTAISPLRPADKISKEECQNIIAATQKILMRAIEAGGSTLHDYKKTDGSLGYFQNQHKVYGKEGQKCPDCTCQSGICKIVQGGRSTFYCPQKQK